MRGTTYDYEFENPDKTKLAFTGHTMPKMLANIKDLTNQHYGIDLKITRDTIYNIINRPAVAHKFYAAKLVVKKNDKPVATTVASQDINNTTQNTTPTTVAETNLSPTLTN